jgi:hypothetical protein
MQQEAEWDECPHFLIPSFVAMGPALITTTLTTLPILSLTTPLVEVATAKAVLLSMDLVATGAKAEDQIERT